MGSPRPWRRWVVQLDSNVTTPCATNPGTCNHNREVIVQEYIQNLLLVEGRKFDIRALILVGRPSRIQSV